MAYVRGVHDSVGVDVMRVAMPRRQHFNAFVETVGDTLTTREKAMLLAPSITSRDALRKFYRIWTTKEAYTKALGLGLGFDFARVDCSFAPESPHRYLATMAKEGTCSTTLTAGPPVSLPSAAIAGTDEESSLDVDPGVVSADTVQDGKRDAVCVDGAPPDGWAFRTLALDTGGEPYEVAVAQTCASGVKPCVVRPLDAKDVELVDAVSFLGEALQLLTQVK